MRLIDNDSYPSGVFVVARAGQFNLIRRPGQVNEDLLYHHEFCVEATVLDLIADGVEPEDDYFLDRIYVCKLCNKTRWIMWPCQHYYFCDQCNDGFPIHIPCWCPERQILGMVSR